MILSVAWGAWPGNTGRICLPKRFIASVTSTGAIIMSVAPRTRATDEGWSRSEMLAEITGLPRQVDSSQGCVIEHGEAAEEQRCSEPRLRRQNDVLKSLSVHKTVAFGGLSPALSEITETAARIVEVERVSARFCSTGGSNIVGLDMNAIEENRYGLQGIRERARLLQGTAMIESSPGEGTRVMVDLPMRTSVSPGSQTEG